MDYPEHSERSEPESGSRKAPDAVARRPWRRPELVTLSVRETRGGFIQTTFEGPFNFLFGVAS